MIIYLHDSIISLSTSNSVPPKILQFFFWLLQANTFWFWSSLFIKKEKKQKKQKKKKRNPLTLWEKCEYDGNKNSLLVNERYTDLTKKLWLTSLFFFFFFHTICWFLKHSKILGATMTYKHTAIKDYYPSWKKKITVIATVTNNKAKDL